MKLSMNIHPKAEWKSVSATLWGKQGGNCLRLIFTEKSGDYAEFTIHHQGGKPEATSLLLMLREALDKLPKTERCACHRDCKEIILCGDLAYDS